MVSDATLQSFVDLPVNSAKSSKLDTMQFRMLR